MQITYGDGRTMLYFQVDLGNDGQNSNPGFVRLMHRLSPGITYLKAASYLLYEDYFSTIRDAILNNSAGVVEDDSGIPLRDFKLSEWNVIPYGNYTGPIGLFKDKSQPDLFDYYIKTPHQPLSFGSGYKFTPSSSSLLVAMKKGSCSCARQSVWIITPSHTHHAPSPGGRRLPVVRTFEAGCLIRSKPEACHNPSRWLSARRARHHRNDLPKRQHPAATVFLERVMEQGKKGVV